MKKVITELLLNISVLGIYCALLCTWCIKHFKSYTIVMSYVGVLAGIVVLIKFVMWLKDDKRNGDK